MFIKLYKYKIRTEDLKKWRRNNDAANSIYREYGVKKLERMIRKSGDSVEINELGYYESHDEFAQIANQIDKDERIEKLFSEFKKLVVGDVIEENYETI